LLLFERVYVTLVLHCVLHICVVAFDNWLINENTATITVFTCCLFSKNHVTLLQRARVVYRQACQLLTDIIFFVAYQENTGIDPFDVQLTHPDRERQKLLREQNVLKEVCTISTLV